MPMTIIDEICFQCNACIYVCPRDAISEINNQPGLIRVVIDPAVCTECEGEGDPKCRSECPVPECIVSIDTYTGETALS